jgi:hypothetical protein
MIGWRGWLVHGAWWALVDMAGGDVTLLSVLGGCWMVGCFVGGRWVMGWWWWWIGCRWRLSLSLFGLAGVAVLGGW